MNLKPARVGGSGDGAGNTAPHEFCSTSSASERVPASERCTWGASNRNQNFHLRTGLTRRRLWSLLTQTVTMAEPNPTRMTSHKRLPSLVVVLGSGPAVQGIVLGPGDRLFDEAKVKVKQLLGLRAGDDRGFAIDRRHGNLCGQKGPGSIGGVLGGSHRSSSCRWIPRSFSISSCTQHCVRPSFAVSGRGRACSAARAGTGRTERSSASATAA